MQREPEKQQFFDGLEASGLDFMSWERRFSLAVDALFNQLIISHRPFSRRIRSLPSRCLSMHSGNGRDASHHARYGYGDPPSMLHSQLEARLFSSRSEAADIMTALEVGYSDQSTSSSKSFGKNLTRFVRVWFLRSHSRDLSAGRLIDWLIDWLIDRLIDWLTDWLVDWNNGCSCSFFLPSQELASRICEEFPHYSEKEQILFITSLAKKFGVDNTKVRNAAKSLTQHVSVFPYLTAVCKY